MSGGASSVDQAGLGLTEILPPLSAGIKGVLFLFFFFAVSDFGVISETVS